MLITHDNGNMYIFEITPQMIITGTRMMNILNMFNQQQKDWCSFPLDNFIPIITNQNPDVKVYFLFNQVNNDLFTQYGNNINVDTLSDQEYFKLYQMVTNNTTVSLVLVANVVTRIGEIWNFCSNPGKRGGGAGKRMIDYVKTHATLIDIIWLGVELKNARVGRFYIKNGFYHPYLMVGSAPVSDISKSDNQDIIVLTFDRNEQKVDESMQLVYFNAIVQDYLEDGIYYVVINQEEVDRFKELLSADTEIGGTLTACGQTCNTIASSCNLKPVELFVGHSDVHAGYFSTEFGAHAQSNNIVATFHTHPYICYQVQHVYIGIPSPEDLVSFIYVFKGNQNASFSFVFAVEAIYYVELTKQFQMFLFNLILVNIETPDISGQCIDMLTSKIQTIGQHYYEYIKSKVDTEIKRLGIYDDKMKPLKNAQTEAIIKTIGNEYVQIMNSITLRQVLGDVSTFCTTKYKNDILKYLDFNVFMIATFDYDNPVVVNPFILKNISSINCNTSLYPVDYHDAIRKANLASDCSILRAGTNPSKFLKATGDDLTVEELNRFTDDLVHIKGTDKTEIREQIDTIATKGGTILNPKNEADRIVTKVLLRYKAIDHKGNNVYMRTPDWNNIIRGLFPNLYWG